MSVYRYPVFFEVHSLDPDQKEKIEKYFRVRRKSGGGDCSSIEKVGDKLYKIAFTESQVQERVLQRAHVLELRGGPLPLTLRGSLEPSSTSTSSVRKTGHLSLPVHPAYPVETSPPSGRGHEQHQDSIYTVKTTPAGGLQHELNLDCYLLRYLNESTGAAHDLQYKLSSLGCSVQLHPEEGRAVVRGQAGSCEAGLLGDVAVRSWKEEVETLFKQFVDKYKCHYEVESQMLQALLQSCTLGSEDVRVYGEGGEGFAVVVGEEAVVQAKLKELKGFQCLGSGKQEMIKTTCRLGQAKLRLLGGVIEKELGEIVPGVKVTRSESSQLVLEGSANDVRTARQLVTDRITLVLEQVVVEVSHNLLSFLRENYGRPGALGSLLGLGGQVELELGDTELHLFSLTVEKLGQAEKALLAEFGEEKIDIPNCASLPAELRSNLDKKVMEMNQNRCRVVARYGPDCRVLLLGHKKQVQELRDEIGVFLIEQSIVEETVRLPFPKIAENLPDLLEKCGVDYTGVTLHPSASSGHPSVVLCGPSVRVTQIRNQLGPILANLVHRTITIDQPGALRFFQGQGREYLERVGRSQQCFIQLSSQGNTVSEAWDGQTPGEIMAAVRYRLQGGLEVVVCQGDITKEKADALVNAANETLDHAGGVAAALSRAGGPEVQRASTELVKQVGRLNTGRVVETTGGNLPCKMLLHAVGPIGGSVGGNERPLLEKTVKTALHLAETLELQTLAMPCISSGIFGVPLKVCSEAIVSAVRDFGRQQRTLRKVTLIDVSREAVIAMKEACDRLLGRSESSEQEGESMTTTTSSLSSHGVITDAYAWEAASSEACVQVEIVQGSIEEQQADALVSPMIGGDPLSSRVGNLLSEAAGPGMRAAFLRESSGQPILPGHKVLVEGLPGFSSGRVFFLNCAPWDQQAQGPAVQALRQGVRRVLESCKNQKFRSVAFPVVGTGVALRFPHNVAAQVLLEEIHTFEQSQTTSKTPFCVRIVIHPSDRESAKAFQTSQNNLHLKGFFMNSCADQASFYRHVSTTQDKVSAMLGNVKLELIFGDIISNTSDVIVNTTDFSEKLSGVSKAVLMAAGSKVQEELAKVGVQKDWMCITGPGNLACREIIHATFMCETQRISKICGKILKLCERKGHHSVTFPAVNTGAGQANADNVSKAMFDGMASTVRDLSPKVLTDIRIVMLQRPVFEAFKSELESRLGTIAPVPTLIERAHQILKKKRRNTSSHINPQPPSLGSRTYPSAPPGLTITPWRPAPAILSVVGSDAEAIDRAKQELEKTMEKQLTKRQVKGEDLWMLREEELQVVQVEAKALGVSLELREGGLEAGAEEVLYIIQGLKEDVLSVREVLDSALSGGLRRYMQEREEAMVALRVQWSMCSRKGHWVELDLHTNYVLEMAYDKEVVAAEVRGLDGGNVKVNLKTKIATDWSTGYTYEMKREESEKLPSYWDDMAVGETQKKVQLLPSSTEYQELVNTFQSTTAAQFTIHKIERVQNVFLWQAYAVCLQRFQAKNGAGDVGEKKLFHGTAAANCDVIESRGFDRSYTTRAAYGVGVYFAVNAQYSANPTFSPPDGAGNQRMYLARVLTGRYTRGDPSMRVTPPRSTTDPTDLYDSLVDNVQTPTMFVIFHDAQAYPEYLITFS
ncbi:hypothetical protein UPYG_G00237140 [Umbra pygmaea]|uniref:Poly [ADP-ribose] polymerase n=1 Tax=Umbra pygmaea TaxID=75934 RepID=A0ABD0WJW2_UMBPY